MRASPPSQPSRVRWRPGPEGNVGPQHPQPGGYDFWAKVRGSCTGQQVRGPVPGPPLHTGGSRAGVPTHGAQSCAPALARLPPSWSARPSSTAPAPQTPGPPLAGRGGAGVGRARAAGGAGPKGGVAGRSGQSCAVRAELVARLGEPAGIPTPRSPAFPRPDPARSRVMELLWAPLLGLCCSLAAADRHTVFWNSSNPK